MLAHAQVRRTLIWSGADREGRVSAVAALDAQGRNAMSRRAVNAERAAEVIAKHQDHYEQDMGRAVSPCMSELAALWPDAFDGYATFRRALLAPDRDDRPGLALKHRHLVLVVTDCVIGNLNGAKNHMRAALKAGLTLEELQDGMGQLLIGCGAPAWCEYGLPVIREAEEFLASGQSTHAA